MENIISGHFSTHADAEGAVRALSESGVPIKHVSIVAQNLQTTETVQGFVTTADVAGAGASTGAWWGGFFGFLVGSAFLWIPGFGPLVVAGALASSFLGLLEGAAVGAVGGGLVGALMGYGLSKDKAIKYESVVRAANYLVLMHGDAMQIRTARDVLERLHASEIEVSERTGDFVAA
jgi:uncharacterized membrane protein